MELTRNGLPRVAITGMGAVTPLGNATELWEGLKQGLSGVRRVDHLDTSTIDVQIAGFVPDFDYHPYIDHKDARRLPRCSQFAIVAAHRALDNAGLGEDDLVQHCERTGTVVGTGLGGFEVLVDGVNDFQAGKRPKPYAIPMGLSNHPVHSISRETKAVGYIESITTACAAGTQALIRAFDLIRAGRADRVFAGGAESTMREYTLGGFDSMTGLATGYNDTPEKACRPFDKNRNGFVFSEGAAILVLETFELAQQRGAHIYAEILGGASSSDAFHFAAMDPEGMGAVRSMTWALENAQLPADAIDYINAHGTGTPINDKTETLAIKRTFGERAYQIPISSTKSMIGHSMGAAGAVEALVCVKTLEAQVIHPTINYETPDEECDLDYVPNQGRDAKVAYALSNNFGLGGQNASIVIGKV